MRRLLSSKFIPVALVIIVVSLITGVALAANNANPASGPSSQLTSSVVEIVPLNLEVAVNGRLEVAGAGFKPGELVLFQIIVGGTALDVVVDGGTANNSGAFRATLDRLPNAVVPGIYTITARTINNPHVASSPLIVCVPTDGKCK